jgi:hypothetical protein
MGIVLHPLAIPALDFVSPVRLVRDGRPIQGE